MISMRLKNILAKNGAVGTITQMDKQQMLRSFSKVIPYCIYQITLCRGRGTSCSCTLGCSFGKKIQRQGYYTANIIAPISDAKTSVTIYNLRFPSHVTEKALQKVLPSLKYEKVTASNAVLFTSHS